MLQLGERKTDDLEALRRLHEVGAQCTNPRVAFQDCLDGILEAAIELSQAQRGNIQLLDNETGSLRIAAHRGFAEAFLNFFALVRHDDASCCSAAMQSAQRVVVEDITQSEIFAGTRSLDVMLESGVRAVQSTPLVSSTGSIVGMISTHFDAPHRLNEPELLLMDLLARQAADYVDRKRKEEQLLQNQRTFFELVERAPFGIYTVDSQFHIAQMNAGSQDGAFRNVRPVIGRDFAEAMGILWPEPVAEEIISIFRRTLETGEPYYSRDFRNLRHDVNVTESYEWEVHRLMLPDGQYGVICYYFDSTRLRDVEQALRRSEQHLEILLGQEQGARKEAEAANRLKDEFLATVSHELRTPLTSILGWSNMLRARHVSADKIPDALEVIERNARAQNHLIDDLLDISRIISGKVRLDVRRIDAVMPIDAALDSLFPAAEAKRVELQRVVDPGIGVVSVDADRLQQIVWNLVSNAIKFTPSGGRVEVRLVVDAHLTIIVSDTGIGIKPEFLPYAFERFRQGDSTATRTHGGLGLGLAIVRHLVELHGGVVYAHSEGEGKGATFTVKLPAVAIPAGNEHGQAAGPGSGGYLPQLETAERLEGLTVLAVDDEPDTCRLLKAMIEKCGAKVIIADSADEALAALLRTQVDLIVSDIGMREKDGYQFMQEVRQLPAHRGGKTPAIALTAFARAEDRLHALRAGYQRHVPKPIEYGELIASMASLSARRGL